MDCQPAQQTIRHQTGKVNFPTNHALFPLARVNSPKNRRLSGIDIIFCQELFNGVNNLALRGAKLFYRHADV